MSDEFLPEIVAAPGWESTQNSSRDSGIALNPSNPELATLFGDWDSGSVGLGPVSDKKAMTLSPFWAGVTLICEAMAIMPINVYKPKKSGSWEMQDQHPVQWAFNRTPNGWFTPNVSRTQMQAHLLFSGNSVSSIQRNGRGQGIGYKTYLPVNTRFYLNEDDTPAYGLRDYPLADGQNMIYSRGSRSPSYFEFDYDEVLHLKAFSTNGYTGLSVLNQARNSIGLGLTMEEFGMKFFTKGRPAGFLTKEGKLSAPVKQVIKEEWAHFQQGVHNAFNIGLLSGGWDWKPMGYTNDDAQFIASREFSVLDFARWLRIPPHMLAELGKATNSNIESLMLEFILYTLMPWIDKWEQEINLKMFTPKELAMGFKAIFDVDAWLRGDSKARNETDKANIWNGIETPKEVRDRKMLPEKLDEAGKPIGDELYIAASQLDTIDNVSKGKSLLQGSGTKDPKTKTAG